MKNINEIAFLIQSRKGSVRVKNKMLKPFNGSCLFEIALQKVLKSKVIPKNKRNSLKKKGSRRVSIKNRKINKTELEKAESKLQEYSKKKTEDIKKELKDSGIKVSGKSNRLLRDIYLYSKMSNINIQHEK